MQSSTIKINFIQLTSLVFCILVFSPIKAQEDSFWNEVSLGIKGGTNVASLISSDNDRMNVRATYQIGFLAEYELSNKFSIQPELLYSRQGQNSRGIENGTRFRNMLMLDYVALPLMVNYHLFDGVWAESGIQAAYLIRAESDEVLGSQSQVQSVKSEFSDFDLLYNIGIRYKTDWGFFIGLRYSIGLNNIVESQFQEANSMRHSIYQFNFGYFF